MRRRLLLGLACFLAVVVATAPAVAAQRLALVVGNAAYAGRALPTTAADAGLVAQALAQAGYEVTAARDLDGKRLRATFHAFADAARDAGPDATILVYLAGLGAQYDGDNYMVPVDAALAHDDDVPLQCVDLDDLSHALAAAPAKARVLLYDLARESPLAPADEMPLAPGLALVTPPKDTLVGFAAAPGTAAPPALLPYGPYARALAEALGPRKDGDGLATGAMLARVRLRVATLTDGAQVPWDTDAPASEAALPNALDKLPPGARSPEVAFAAVLARDSLDGYADFLRAVPDGPLAARVRVLLALRREATMWRAVAGSDDPRAAWTYMRRYPRGPHRFDARRRLATLKAQLEPPPRFDPVAFADAPPPGDGELALVAHPHEAQRGLPPIPAPPDALLPPADPAYYDDLPMPTPAPRDLLPVTIPLPQDAATTPAKITQTGADGDTVTATQVAPDGGSLLSLSDDKGLLLTFKTRTEPTGTRVTVEMGAKGDVKSRTTTTRAGAATTIVLADAAGAPLMKLVARTEADGAHTTRVTDGDGSVLAAWRRDGAGVVVAGEAATQPTRPAPAAAATLPAAPTSPTIAVPTLAKPQLHPPRSAPAPTIVPTAPVPALPKPAAPAVSPAQAPPAAPAPVPAAPPDHAAPPAPPPEARPAPATPRAAPAVTPAPPVTSPEPPTAAPAPPLPPPPPRPQETKAHERTSAHAPGPRGKRPPGTRAQPHGQGQGHAQVHAQAKGRAETRAKPAPRAKAPQRRKGKTSR